MFQQGDYYFRNGPPKLLGGGGQCGENVCTSQGENSNSLDSRSVFFFFPAQPSTAKRWLNSRVKFGLIVHCSLLDFFTPSRREDVLTSPHLYADTVS